MTNCEPGGRLGVMRRMDGTIVTRPGTATHRSSPVTVLFPRLSEERIVAVVDENRPVDTDSR
jgi:hypothetical protein